MELMEFPSLPAFPIASSVNVALQSWLHSMPHLLTTPTDTPQAAGILNLHLFSGHCAPAFDGRQTVKPGQSFLPHLCFGDIICICWRALRLLNIKAKKMMVKNKVLSSLANFTFV
jgi:hypothetical protein